MSRIIDAHVHLWPPRKPGDRVHAWPGVIEEPPELDARAETLIVQMDAHEVRRAIVVQTPWRYDDDSYLSEVIARFPGRFTGVGSFPMFLREADVAHEAARLGHNGLEGVRLHVAGPDALQIFAGAALDPLYRRASETALPVLFLTRNYAAFPLYGRVAEAWPDLRMVVEHMGHVTANFGGGPADEDALMALSAHANVYVKLGIHHQHSQGAYPWTDLHRIQRRFLDMFGADRLLWGSNWPMRLPAPSYQERLETLTRHFPFASEEERDQVMGRTAEALWPERVTVGATS
jgi:L-fuconolactonase